MKRRWTLALVGLLVLIGTGPVYGQIFGSFSLPAGVNAASGTLRITGWALSPAGIRRVVVQVDGTDIGQADYGKFRPDVEAVFPGFPDSPAAGFGYILNSTDFLNGLHTLSIKVESLAGEITTLEVRKTIQFQNTVHNLVPFGAIQRPQRNAQLYGTCDTTNPFRRYTVVTGWVLDLGVEIGDTGVGYVELLLDGAVLANSRLNCGYSLDLGGPVNCYGLPRLDIEHIYPFALDAPSAGFRFVLDVGALIASGRAQGHHILSLRSGDVTNQESNPHEIPVTFWCIENIPNEGAFGAIETPRPGRIFAGQMRFEGWALDWETVNRVEVYVDGVYIGDAAYGVDSRASVRAQFPGYPDTDFPVWRLNYDSNDFSDGVHQVQILVIDDLGVRTVIGETSFFVDNMNPDTP